MHHNLRYVNLDAPKNREAVRVMMSAAFGKFIFHCSENPVIWY
jgi:hypothetical protein